MKKTSSYKVVLIVIGIIIAVTLGTVFMFNKFP